MATKKVEEKKDKKVKNGNNKKVEKKNKVNKKDTVKETVVEEVKKVCPSCGKKFLSTLDECPKCGYSDAKNTMYDDEENVDDFEEYDDEEDVVEVKKTKTEKREELVKVEKKKEKEKKVKYVDSRSSFNSQNNDILDLIKILIAVVILVVVVYFVIALVNGDFKDDKKDTNPAEDVTASIQNEKILVSSVFDKADEEYYVLIYDAGDEGSELYYGSIYDTYKSIADEDVIPMFWVDLSDGFNSEYAVSEDEKSNPNVKDDYKDLKLQSPTLIRVKKGKNVDYYEGDAVAETISEIVASYNEEEK